MSSQDPLQPMPSPPRLMPQACIRCHAKKRKCDRRLPSCTACMIASVPCELDSKRPDRELWRQSQEWSAERHRLLEQIAALEQDVQSKEGIIRELTQKVASKLQADPSDNTNIAASLDDFSMESLQPAVSARKASTDLLSRVSLRTARISPASQSFQDPSTTVTVSLVDLPPIAETYKIGKSFTAFHKQTPLAVGEAELEADIQIVYGPQGLVHPNFAASRFRCFMALYCSGEEHASVRLQKPLSYFRTLALREIDGLIAKDDLTSVQTFVLLAMMALREPDGPNLWHLVGLASRTALAISLNRRDSVYLPTVESGIDGEGLLQAHNERRTNIFWALYGLDRLAMFTLNMPPSIRDEDIDIAMPVESTIATGSLVSVSSVAVRCHGLRARRLYGQIRESLYGVSVSPDLPMPTKEALVRNYVIQAQQWYSSSPLKVAFIPISESTVKRQWLDDIQYHQMIMALHRVSPLFPNIPSSFVPTLRDSASISVDLYAHYSAQNHIAVNWVHLYQLFISCTTLVYSLCECKSRSDLTETPYAESWTKISHCRNLLAQFGAEWPQSQRYQAMFDVLVKTWENFYTVPFSAEDAQPAILDGVNSGMGLENMIPIDQWASDQQDDFIALINRETVSPSTVMRGFWGDSAV